MLPLAQNMNSTVIKNKPLGFWICYFLEDYIYPTRKQNLFLECRSKGVFLSGSGPEGEYYGHLLCSIICALIYLVGIFGIVTNIINVIVLRKSLKGSSMQNLLITLSILDLMGCAFGLGYSTIMMLILDNVTRGGSALYAFKIFHVLYSIGRSGSIYVTILVTIERYLVVAYPIKSKSWLSLIRSRCYLGAVIAFTILLDLPWILNTTIAKNDLPIHANSSLASFSYIFKSTYFGKNVYPPMRYPLLIMNYAAPFPLLLLFNGLLYRSINSWNKTRQKLSGKQRTEINAAKMFSVICVILIVCHSVSCVIFIANRGLKVVYRELMLLQVLSVAISAAINFIVYYRMGKAFQDEFWKLMVRTRLWKPSEKRTSLKMQRTTGDPSQTTKESCDGGTSGDETGDEKMVTVDLN